MRQSNPKLIVIAGPNGAGKSTFAPLLVRETFRIAHYVNADDIASRLAPSAPQEAAVRAAQEMLESLRQLTRRRESFAFETTLSTRSFAPFIRRARETGYGFHLYFLWLRDAQLSVARVKQRAQAGGHDIAAEIIRRRYPRTVRNFFQLYRPLADTWQVFDNSDYNAPALIAEGRADARPRVARDELWRLFREAASVG